MEQKKKLWKGMLGIILCFVLALGLMPGTSKTARAETTYDPASTYTGFATLMNADDTEKLVG